MMGTLSEFGSLRIRRTDPGTKNPAEGAGSRGGSGSRAYFFDAVCSKMACVRRTTPPCEIMW